MDDKSRMSLEYLQEFTDQELWDELKRRKWETPGKLWNIPFVKPDGCLDMGVEDPPGTVSSVSWHSHVNWAVLATHCEYVINTEPDAYTHGTPGPHVYRKNTEGGYAATHYVGSLRDSRVQAILLSAHLGYEEPSQIVEWDVWKIPKETNFKYWCRDGQGRSGLPITAELHVGNITDHGEAWKQCPLGCEDGNYYMMRLSSRREELWQAILAERSKHPLYNDW